VLYAPSIKETTKAIAANGTTVQTAEVTGPNGHVNGVFAIGQAAAKIKAFLSR